MVSEIDSHLTNIQVPWRITAGEDHASITKLLVQADKIRWQKVTTKQKVKHEAKYQLWIKDPTCPTFQLKLRDVTVVSGTRKSDIPAW